jgi:Domain of unknown function (DUF4145)
MAKASKAPPLERVHCNTCRQKTRHRLLCTAVDEGLEEIEEVGATFCWKTTFETLQCCGCGEAVLRRTSVSDADPGEPIVQYFPPEVSRHPPSWQYSIPNELRSVMREVYRSLDANNRRLPMMGARTLVDLLMVEKVGDVGTFDQKLKQLENRGLISSYNREVLTAALDVGSAAAHRGHAPKAAEVSSVMDIVENVLHAVYVLPRMAQNLRKSTPQRPIRKAKP